MSYQRTHKDAISATDCRLREPRLRTRDLAAQLKGGGLLVDEQTLAAQVCEAHSPASTINAHEARGKSCIEPR